MRNLFRAIILGLLLGSLGGAQQQFPPAGTTGVVGHTYPRYFQGHATLSNGLLAYWPLDEPTGAMTFRDVVGKYELRRLQGATAITSVAGVFGTATKTLRTPIATVADTVVTATTPQGYGTITSASAGLPVFAAGDFFVIVSAGNTWMGRAVSQGTASSVNVVRDGEDDYAIATAASQSATFYGPNWLFRGNNQLGGFGGFAPDYGRTQDAQINTDGGKGVTFTFWLRIPTGAPTGKNYFSNGTVFASSIGSSDANSTQVTVSCGFTDVGGGNATQTGSTVPALDTWYFIACLYDPVTRQATYNRNAGVSVVSGAAMGGTSQPNVDFEYGGGRLEVMGSYRTLTSLGGVDMHALGYWNRVLSGAELTYLFNGGAGRPITP